MGREAAWRRIKEVGIIPAVRGADLAEGVHAVEAILNGGLPVVEISLAADHSEAVLKSVVNAHSSRALIGAGSVVDAAGVRLAAASGAQFIVTPGFSAEAVEVAHSLDLAIFAGAITPTEVQVAAASGAEAVKLFPCNSMGGPRYLRALRGQYPQVSFIASGGVNLENCGDYMRAGAVAVGVGGDIADAESMSVGDHRVFTVRARRFREALANVRAVFDRDPSINVGEAR